MAPGFNPLELDPLGKVTARLEALRAQLDAAPICEVIGVVHPSGARGSSFGAQGEGMMELKFELEPWRMDGGATQIKSLLVLKEVDEAELDHMMASIHGYQVMRIDARVAMNNALGSPRARLESVAEMDATDTEMRAHAERLQQPVIHRDSALGTFTLDRSTGAYGADCLWTGQSVRLELIATDAAEQEKAIRHAHALWEKQVKWNEKITAFTAKKMLPLKNRLWREEGEARVCAADFKARISLKSINVEPDGAFQFWYEDCDLFGGHMIEVRGTLRKGPIAADLVG